MKVLLVSNTPYPENVVTAAMRLCYSKDDISTILQGGNAELCEKMIAKCLDLGHTSVLEHVSFTFGIEGISRACSHQLVRHRIASYSQQSQRYVKLDETDDWFVTPHSMEREDVKFHYLEEMSEAVGGYQSALNRKIPCEDARYILPNATKTNFMMTMNARSLLNFFEHRMCVRAQWEIRELAAKMLEAVADVAPNIFRNAGPTCASAGYCREGAMSCGKAPTLETLKEVWKESKTGA